MTEQKLGAEKSEKGQTGNVGISVGGNVGPGAVLGPNSHVQADNIAGRDITIQGPEPATQKVEDFSTLLGDLRGLIEQAREKGELTEGDADKALDSIEVASTLAVQEKPPKKALLGKLEDISDLLDGAADTIESAGGAARTILKAIPIVALLLKLASYLF